MFKYRKIVVIAWVAIFLGLAAFASQAQSKLTDNGFTPKGSDSDLGLQVMADTFGGEKVYLRLLYKSDKLDLTLPANKLAIEQSLQPLVDKKLAEAPLWMTAKKLDLSPKVIGLQLPLKLSADEAIKKYGDIRAKIQAPKEMDVYVSGGSAVLHDLSKASKKDAIRAEMIGLPIALLVLVIVFGTLYASLLPLVVGMVSMTTTLGIFYFVASAGVSLSSYLPNIVTMLGLAVGIDYALFLVSRFREELTHQASIEDAVAETAHTAGRSIFFSGLAVLVGLLGMLFIPLNFFRSLCLGGVVVVTLSVLVGNTLLLALLGMIGEKINRFPLLPKRFRIENRKGNIWRGIAHAVMRRPFLLALGIIAVLIGLLAPLFGAKLGVPGAEVLPPKYESRSAQDLLYATYDQRELEPIFITLEAPTPFDDSATIISVRKYVEALKTVKGVTTVYAYTDLVAQFPTSEQASQALQNPVIRKQLALTSAAKKNVADIQVVTDYKPKSANMNTLIDKLRGMNAQGMTVHVTGSDAYSKDMITAITSRIPAVLAFVLGITFVILLFAFRSVVLPLKAVLMNVLSLGASLGVVVSVFQNGHFASLFEITSTGYVNATTPVLIFCVVFGISMDYEVFLISRIIEDYERSGDNAWSTAEGLRYTGGLITSAAFILIVVVGTFMFTDIEIMKSLGMGLSLAVLLDATVVRVVLVPALMKLLGKANWWAPKWLGPIQPGTQKPEDV
jgi:RND superfamily putative drug exporter